MYFLKKIYAIIEDERARQELERWAEIYQDGPFEVEILNMQPLGEKTITVTDGEEIRILADAVRAQDTVLWITDCAAYARLLMSTAEEVSGGGAAGVSVSETTEAAKSERMAVLAYLHDRNTGGSVAGCDETVANNDFSCCRYAMMHPLELDAEYFELIYRRLKRLPWDILETARCRLRESTVADVPAFYEIYKEPSITAYMENLFPTPEEESAYMEDYIDKVYAYYDFGVWTVLEKSTGQVIGRAGLSYREGFQDPEIGFVIGVPWQGQGLAYEVCRAVLDYGRRVLDIDRVQAFVEPENQPSLALCRKLGFEEAERLTLGGKEYIRLTIAL